MDDAFHPTILNFTAGSAVVVEGKQNADRFYIIQQGKVRIKRDIDVLIEEKQSIAEAGDIIGAVSAMSSYSYIETLVALTNVVLVEVRREQYPGLIKSSPAVAVKIVRQFSQRLRELDKMLSRRTLSAAAGDDSAHILQVADYYMGQKKYNHAFYAYQQYAAHCPGAPNLGEVKQKMMKIAPQVKVQKPLYPPDKMVRAYPKNSLIFAEGEKGEELYVIQDGTVNITKIIDNQEMVLAVLKKGNIFGEMALLEDKPRAATAEVSEDCTVLAINRKNFETVSRAQPDMISRLTSAMAERIWVIYKQIATTLLADPVGRMYNALLVQLEKDRIAVNTNQSHQCNFGFKELSGMAGIPAAEGEIYGRKMLLTGRIQLIKGKIFVADTSEVKRQTDYYLRAQKISRNG
ncbi:MAG: cyclic nucleotide-binding domain-containing protein [Treponema sp.]|jgi:CRP-like cAMP-binding protein|nr:cyclic nucleotide-binding domain-containing protein [Treponema sp.]